MSEEPTMSSAYADHLARAGGVWWKRILPVQAPYRWNLRRERLGRTLDVGCGAGRNLVNLPAGSVGVDHNLALVAVARRAGCSALTVEEFESRSWEPFDSLLFAHVVEHMTRDDALTLVNTYVRHLRPGGSVLFICPQERGFATDPTHVEFFDGTALVRLARDAGLTATDWRSFPFPRAIGRWFPYNEFVVRAVKSAGQAK